MRSFLLFCAVTATSTQECVYRHQLSKTNSTHELIFDLRPSKGIIFQATSKVWTYKYSPCENGLQCPTKKKQEKDAMAMVIQQTNERCGPLGIWNASIQPVYNPSQKTWSFTFRTGKPFGSCGERSFVVTWHCNPSKRIRLVQKAPF